MKATSKYLFLLFCSYINPNIVANDFPTNYLKKFPRFDELEKATNLNRGELVDCLKWIEKEEKFYQIDMDWNGYYNVLPNLINQFNLKTGCEVGVGFGRHSENILLKTNLSNLYSIDPYYVGFPECTSPKAPEYFDILYLKVKDILSVFGNRSTVLRTSSFEASKMFLLSSLDFVFIDAVHDYKSVTEDLTIWYDKVKPGGIMCGDDYVPNCDVPQAVNDFFSKKNLPVFQNKEYSRIWYIFKPN